MIEVVRIEKFSYEVPGYRPVAWNINIAKELVESGRVVRRVEIDREELRNIMTRNAWDEEGVARADPSKPGIGAPIVDHVNKCVLYVLIDGTHRAVRALRDGVPFTANLLTDAAAEACTICGPDSLLPWRYRRRSRRDPAV